MAIEEIKRLIQLDFNKQVAFAYLTCERVFPNYEFFSKNYNFGDPNIMRQSIDFIYNSLNQTATINGQQIEHLLTMVYKNTPNTNDFTTFYATICMYSGGVIYESVNLLKKTDFNRILTDISDMAINAIDCFIQERDDMDYEDINFETKILNDPLMQNEIALQKGVISYLSNIDTVLLSDITTIIQFQENNKNTLIL